MEIGANSKNARKILNTGAKIRVVYLTVGVNVTAMCIQINLEALVLFHKRKAK